MKYLLLLAITVLCSCGSPEKSDTGYIKENGYKLIEKNSRWKIYQVNDSCLLTVPNFNNRDDKPIILKIK